MSDQLYVVFKVIFHGILLLVTSSSCSDPRGFCVYEVGASRRKNLQTHIDEEHVLIPAGHITFFSLRW